VAYDLGVDLGTTFTAAGICVARRVEAVSLGVRRLEVPSVVFLTEEGEFLVGEPAERRGVGQPTRVAREFKRRMGDPVPILVAGAPHSPQSLAARVLRWVVDVVSAGQGERPSRIVVTCPANWGPFKRDVLEQTVHLADVGPVTIATEPECAALQYASTTRVADGEVIAVYDLGGGTFDAAVLRKTRTGFAPLGTPEGIENLGGADFDEALFGYARTVLADKLTSLDPADPGTLAALAQLRRECTDAKEALSSDSHAAINVALPNVQTQIRITRAEFEEMIRPALNETLDAVRRVLRSADVQLDQLKCIVLVGGSSRIPLVADLIRTELGVQTALDIHPKHAVALGAALLPSAATEVARSGEPAVPLPPIPLGAPIPPAPAATPIPALPPLAGPAPDLLQAPPSERKRWLWPVVGAAAVAAVVVGALALGGGGGDDDDGGATTPTSPAIELPRAAALPASSLLVAERSAWQIWRLDVGGGEPRPLTDNSPGMTMLPALSPDRKTVAYTWVKDDGTELWLMASDGSGDEIAARGLDQFARAAWSPDGTRLAYVRKDGDQLDLVILDLDGGDVTVATDDAAMEGDPAWSKDGKQIAFWKMVDGHTQLFLYDVFTKKSEQLTEGDANDADPNWSVDGKLAFARVPDGVTPVCTGLWVIDVTTKVETQLTDGATVRRDDSDPAWSPDGKQLAFESRANCDPQAPFHVGVIDADGSGFADLTEAGTFSHPAW
jgi:molecular chaperone DnaK